MKRLSRPSKLSTVAPAIVPPEKKLFLIEDEEILAPDKEDTEPAEPAIPPAENFLLLLRIALEINLFTVTVSVVAACAPSADSMKSTTNPPLILSVPLYVFCVKNISNKSPNSPRPPPPPPDDPD